MSILLSDTKGKAAAASTATIPQYGISTGSVALGWDASTRAYAIERMQHLANGQPFAVRFDAGVNTATYNMIEGCLNAGLTPYLIPHDTTGPIANDSTGQQLATRYRGEGLIFTSPNEPDLHGWTPAQLTAYQSPFYDSIKAGDPNALCGYGAFWKGVDANTTPQKFIQRFIADCPTKADFFSFHGYDPPTSSLNTSWNVWGYWFPLGFYNGSTCSELLAAAGLGSKPIISDECGLRTTGQAQWDFNKLLLDQVPSRVDGCFIFSLLPDADPGFQIIEADHTERIAYTSMVTYISGGSTPPPSTFGETSIGDQDDTQYGNLKNVCAASVPTSGTISKLTGYVSGLGPGVGNQKLKAIMYADSGGSPGALIAASNEVTITDNSAYSWRDFTFASPPAVTASTTVWIGYIGDTPNDGSQLKAFTASGAKYNTDTYSDGPSATFGAASAFSFRYSLYGTYV